MEKIDEWVNVFHHLPANIVANALKALNIDCLTGNIKLPKIVAIQYNDSI